MMPLLDRILQKSRSPYTKEDIAFLMRQYGEKVRVLTRTNAKGDLAAFAILTLPVPFYGGKQACTIVAAGTDGTVDARAHFQELKQAARLLGADTLVVNTWRNPKAMVKWFGATIDSVTLTWDLAEGNGQHAASRPAIFESRSRD